MTVLQKLQLRGSEIRQRLAELSGLDRELTEDERGEVDTLTAEFKNNEVRHRAALIASSDAGEEQEAEQVRNRAQLSEYVRCAVEGATVAGAEAELQSVSGLRAGEHSIPWAVLDINEEVRERAEVPGAGERGSTAEATLRRVFPMSVTEFLRVRSPVVAAGERHFPVIDSGDDPSFQSAGTEAFSTGGVNYRVSTLSPTRLTAWYRFAREDAKAFAALEADMRADLSAAMRSAMDRMVVLGSAAGGAGSSAVSIDGLNNLAYTGAAPSAKAAFADFVELVAGRVDGTYADNEMAVRALLGPASYRVAAASFLTNAGPPSASTYVRTMSGGLRASEHVPAAVSDLQDAYTVRGMMSPAVLPRWEGIALIRDEISGADQGQIALTMIAMVNFAVIRAEQYARLRVHV